MKFKGKMKKNKIKLMLSALVVTQVLSSCGAKDTQNDLENKCENNVIEDLQDIDSLDDVIITYSEEGYKFSEIASSHINDIFNVENENIDTTYFCITEDSVEKQFVGFAEEIVIRDHVYNSLYNKQNDSINWPLVAEKVYENSLKLEKDGYVALPLEDVTYVLNLLDSYIEKISGDYPEISMKEIACKLENYNLFYSKSKYPILAGTAKNYIAYYDDDSNIRMFDPNDNISIHEFFHFLCFGCNCKTEIMDFQAEGLNIKTPIVYQNDTDEFILYSDEEIYGIYYTFIEEAIAEHRNVYQYGTESPVAYFHYQKIVDNIEIALSLNENYCIDEYVAQCLYRRPIDFIRNFPVGNENTKNNFTDNVRMLVIYDALLRNSYPNNERLAKCLNKCDTYDEEVACKANLINYCQSQLTKLFFSNLIVLSEQHPEESLYEYYSYLITMFDKRMQQANQILLDNLELPEDLELVTEKYNNYFNEYKTYYLSYLMSINPNACAEIITIFNCVESYDIFEIRPDFLSSERVRLYSLLELEMSYDDIYYTIPRLLKLEK